MAHRFGARTGGARFSVVFDIGQESGPVVVEADLIKGLGLTIMSCKGMVMRVSKNTKVYASGMPEQTVRTKGLPQVSSGI